MMLEQKIQAVLVDKQSWPILLTELFTKMASAQFIGFDIETHDADRHEGLNRLMNVSDEGHKASNKKLVFDVNRTTITGFSLYFKGDPVAYYFNLAHADVENRLPWEWTKPLLDQKPPASYWVSHNDPFELTMMFKSLGYDLGPNILCSMQLAVTCFNSDTYDKADFISPDLGGIPKLFPQVLKLFSVWEPGQELSNEQQELLSKVTAKESDADHSYNGYVKSIAYGFGLKQLSKRFLGYEQKTFQEVLNGRAHMGQLTGAEVCEYGADDAWVCVHLFDKLLAWLMANNPEAVNTYFTQENPMGEIYSRVWREGVRVDRGAIMKRRDIERENVARILRRLKSAVKAMLPYPADLHEKLLKYDSKFENNAAKYRAAIEKWAKSPDSDDTFTQVYQVRGSTAKAMAEERGKPESKTAPNLTYYMAVRSILYDLCRCSFQLAHGKVQSDADARDVMKERLMKKHEIPGNKDTKDYQFPAGTDGKVMATLAILDCYKEIASSEQVTKLFITNYLNMIDPDTGRMYPQLSSKLDTRRMALESPNLSQLPKNSGLAYVRGFFLADEEDHVVLSADWSGLELVLIGEFSGDLRFKQAFGQLPYEDMHSPAAAAVLGITLEEFHKLPNKKALRTDLGKGSNFNYFYSGALGTVGDRMGWSSEQMWAAVEKYRQTFPEAEAWRTKTIEEGRINGYVQLPDKLIRYRFEATYEWAAIMRSKFAQHGPVIANFGELVIKKVMSRAGNQCVNAKIQGSNATMTKRSILTMQNKIKEQGFRARFLFPCHDELIYSVHKDDVVRFVPVLREVMCTHPGVVKDLVLNVQVAIGKNYWAFDATDNPYGQLELDEWSKKYPVPELEHMDGKKLDKSQIPLVLRYLFS